MTPSRKLYLMGAWHATTTSFFFARPRIPKDAAADSCRMDGQILPWFELCRPPADVGVAYAGPVSHHRAAVGIHERADARQNPRP